MLKYVRHFNKKWEVYLYNFIVKLKSSCSGNNNGPKFAQIQYLIPTKICTNIFHEIVTLPIVPFLRAGVIFRHPAGAAFKVVPIQLKNALKTVFSLPEAVLKLSFRIRFSALVVLVSIVFLSSNLCSLRSFFNLWNSKMSQVDMSGLHVAGGAVGL